MNLIADQEAPAARPPVSIGADESEVIGRVESDRYCDACGYNMVTLPVFQDAASNLLLVRCTECGSLHPANQLTTVGRVWLGRLGVSLLAGWMLLVIWLLFMAGLAETGMHLFTVEGLTTYDYQTQSRVVEYPSHDEFVFLVIVASLVSFLVPFVEFSLLAASAHHWPRWVYPIAAAVLPLVPFAIARQNWIARFPDLADWALGVLAVIYAIQVAGGLTAALLRRRQTRLLASILLPPRLRASMAFLWIADGLTPPAAPKPRRRPS